MITAILLLAGQSTRANTLINKVYCKLYNKPVFKHSLDKFIKIKEINEIIIVYNNKELELLKELLKEYQTYNIKLVEGGISRNESVTNALKVLTNNFAIIHDGARPYTSINDILRVIDALNDFDVVTLYKKAVDAIKYRGKTLDKNEVFLVSTPQGFNKDAINYLINHPTHNAYDELEVLENENFKTKYLEETSKNDKITYATDFEKDYKVGYSLDFHPFKPSDYLLLGGVKIPSNVGLDGVSDADVIYHAVTEAIFGALHLKDLGSNYPDDSNKYKDFNSSYFLKDAKQALKENMYEVVNIDMMVYLEKPKLKPYIEQIEANVASILDIDKHLVSIKATTLEGKGKIGLCQGIACEAYILINKII